MLSIILLLVPLIYMIWQNNGAPLWVWICLICAIVVELINGIIVYITNSVLDRLQMVPITLETTQDEDDDDVSM